MSSTKRLDYLRDIEKSVQALWEERRPYEVEAPEGDSVDNSNHYYLTFPYPYMNGRLHLGHAFSLTKCEFTARFKRLDGKHVLWPFAFHCTGMPIAASADKIKNELEELSQEGESDDEKAVAGPDGQEEADSEMVVESAVTNKYTSRKSKAVSKFGNAKSQISILQSIGVPEDEIPSFADARHWLKYFPPRGQADLKLFGLGVDWRRSFITTEANAYYDKFVQWQFTLLKERNRLKFGLRPAIFSRVENQPCADHDRAEGEGVNPMQLNLVALPVHTMGDSALAAICGDRTVKIVASTTKLGKAVIGKPHFFLNEEEDFGVFVAFDRQLTAEDICSSKENSFIAFKALMEAEADACRTVLILHPRAAENLMYQGYLPARADDPMKPYCLGTFKASALTNTVVSTYEGCEHATLTAKFVGKIVKGPRIVVSGVADESATTEYDEELKRLMQQQVAFTYYEPENRVVSRSHDECVVALCNQWYCDYGNREWKDMVANHVKSGFEGFGTEAAYLRTIDWLDGWACSRNYGLGTFLPWELQRGNKIVIESLSDSTIYFAYYTIAHFLQSDLYGEKSGLLNITPDQLTREVFDYIFLQTDALPTTQIPVDSLNKMRNSFAYWYPMSLRCSGKDLLTNHLTMSLFNHAAIWPERPDLWPRSFYVNGHILLNSEKMSKQTGNFLTLTESMDKFSTDGTRIALADAGDSADDANFEQANAVSALMKLYVMAKHVEEFVENNKAQDKLRFGSKTEIDEIFENECDLLAKQAHVAYNTMAMRDASKYAFYAQISLRDWYLLILGNEVAHADSIKRWIEVVALTLSPIAPHVCEHIWSNLLEKPTLIVKESWPAARYPKEKSCELHLKYDMLASFGEDARKLIEKCKKKPVSVTGIVASHYPAEHKAILKLLRNSPKNEDGIPTDWSGAMKTDPEIKELCAGNKKAFPMLMAFASYRVRQAGVHGDLALVEELPFDEYEFFNRYLPYLTYSIGLPVSFQKVTAGSFGDKKMPPLPGAPVCELGY